MIAKVIRSGLLVFPLIPQNRQIKKRWLTAIKREQHRDGFEMSVGISASVLQETILKLKRLAQLVLAALSSTIWILSTPASLSCFNVGARNDDARDDA